MVIPLYAVTSSVASFSIQSAAAVDYSNIVV